jgi:hypothetical protein
MAPESPHVNCRITPNDEMWSRSDSRYFGNCLRSYASWASRAAFPSTFIKFPLSSGYVHRAPK